MKKITFIIALALLASCSKEDNCTEAFINYEKEVKPWMTPLRPEKISEINKKYNSAYPNCGFPNK